MPLLMAPEIEEITTQNQKSKDSLRLEYEELVDETVVESMIITTVLLIIIMIIKLKNEALKETVEKTEKECNEWKVKYENAINENSVLKDQIGFMEQLQSKDFEDLDEPKDNPDDQKILFDLCEKGDLDQLKPLLLVSKEKNPKHPKNLRISLLHQAARFGHLEIVKFIAPMIEDKNPKNENGATPLHYAALLGHKEVVKYLVTVVADKHPIDCSGRSPGYLAIQNGHMEIANIFQIN